MLMATGANGSVSRRVPYLAVYLMFTAVTAEAGPDSVTTGSQRANTELSAPRSFDIPAQPLAAALDRYGDTTGREVLYNPSLTDGRTSETVKGTFAPEAALQLLLAGTGLTARFLKDSSFVLGLAPEAAGPSGGSAAARQYYGVVQARLRDALCRATGVQPGSYRMTALVWIEPSGTVTKFERLGSAGSAELDHGIDKVLRNLSVGAPVPAGFSQPILIMILPRAPGVTMSCDATALPQAAGGVR
jgi:hypothetical protein